MSKKTMFHTRFWEDNFVYDLDPVEKLLFIYAMTNPRISLSGIYEAPLKAIAIDTGIERELLPKLFERFKKEKKIIYQDGWLCVVNYPKYQNYNKTTMVTALSREIELIPKKLLDIFIGYGYPIDTLSLGYKVQAKEQVKDKVKEQEGKNKHGEFQNVVLTDVEYVNLVSALNEGAVQGLIAELDGYIESTGKKYKSHYATLQNWARRRIKDFTVENRKANKPKRQII